MGGRKMFGKAIDRNELPAELKVTIVQAQTLVDEIRRRKKENARDIDLTCKAQLRSDCNAVESYIKALFKGKKIEQNAKELELAVIRLQTSADGILKE